MAAALESSPRARLRAAQPWLRNPRWDLLYVIFSVVLAFVPYSVFLLFGAAGTFETKGTAAYEARMFINTLVSVLIGGPHMYATFTRTFMDPVFFRRRFALIAVSIAIPFLVFASAIYSYDTYVWLLTIFFATASLHALYQIIWLSDAYSAKARRLFTRSGQLIDYGLILTCLYPIATYKMVQGRFTIGPVALKYHDLITRWLPALPGNSPLWSGHYWLAALAFLAFAVMLVLWLVKTVHEARGGYLNVPKTLLIACTVPLMFFTPALPNMDTALQGINVWHSFQYLALTWYANRLLEQHTGRRVGFMHWLDAPPGARLGRTSVGRKGLWRGLTEAALSPLRRLDRGTGWTAFYLVCLAMLPISGLLMWGAASMWPGLGERGPGADEVYSYMGILAVLLVHYAQDAILFRKSIDLVA